jgi:hypothetical protein
MYFPRDKKPDLKMSAAKLLSPVGRIVNGA